MARSRPSAAVRLVLIVGAALAPPLSGLAVGSAASAASGDGNDRLTTFGDRGLTTFGDRGLASFSDIPLIPMGGADIPGWSASHREAPRQTANAKPSRPPCTRRSRRQFPFIVVGDRNGQTLASGGSAVRSIASLRGVPLTVAATAVSVELPAVELPSITLDHRPLLADLAVELEQARFAADARGAHDLAGSIEAARAR